MKMWNKLRKNEAYSKLLLEEGSETSVDEDSDYTMELPDYVDEKKMKLGQLFILLNINAFVRAVTYSLMATASTYSITRLLIFTKQSSTEASAYKRFKANALHAQLWYRNPVVPGTKAWKSLEIVRKMHVSMQRKSVKAGHGIISQKDMALTQFTFMGFMLLNPKQFGIAGSLEQFEAFNHLWRVLGHLLGVQEEFNLCGPTLEETLSRLEAIREDIFVPQFQNPFKEFKSYTRTAVNGMWSSDPCLHYESLMWSVKRSLKVPGYFYFDSESTGDKRIYDELSFYTKFRIILDIIAFEYLSHFFVFRWLFNITRILFALFNDAFPILASLRFGKKYSKLDIFKSSY